MTIQEMIERKRELGLTNEIIAQRSGVPLGTVQKIFAGLTKSPRRKTIEALEALLLPANAASPERSLYRRSGSAGKASSYVRPASVYSGMVQEPRPAYDPDPMQGHYTIDDYYAIPDERRVELIDGWIYDMAAPSEKHQIILGDLFYQLYPCVAEHPECRLFFAPLDVRLDNDEWTMVQPDLLIVCHDDPDRRRVNGAPDFVAEILSPSSRYHDMYRKFRKYHEAGVREYWIIDPEHLKVTVWHFEKETLPETYTFQDEVELRISDGRCKVDFKSIYQNIERYLGK